MKHAVIVAHPRVDSFTMTTARTWQSTAEAAGHTVEMRDLYRLNFDPRLRDGEIPRPSGFAPADDVKRERHAIGDADVFVFVYPLWFYAPPAMLKGYVDRVFGMGFGYGPQQHGGNSTLLDGKKLLSFTSSGAPTSWVEDQGDLAAIRRLFDSHMAKVCGLEVLDHINFGGIVPNMRPDAIERYQQSVRATFATLFHTLQ